MARRTDAAARTAAQSIEDSARAGLSSCGRGVWIDADANLRNEARLSTKDSAVEVRIIPTDEESVISRHTLAVLS